MAKTNKELIKVIPDETILRKIYVLRGEKVMLDMDLAVLYGVDNKQLKRQVRRNIIRFPVDFMFQINVEEYQSLRSQIGTSKNRGGTRYMPYAFTEQGISMLSAVINSPRAIEMHIAIMRAFVEMRKLLHSNKKIAEQIKLLFEKIEGHDAQLKVIYDAIENLLDDKVEQKTWEERERIGFKIKK